ncbi:hypothetical protein [Streptomyces antarcticus]|uniref:hypothetical protein n=1 Tax=Streptomyces antarcticus TaxID=2996458 RepID=UPI00226DC15D|nr:MULTISPECIES: hypothetical protein [unclassified Streptomyces]MCY0945311.1 hypothetical protein [Streptomyces sp. H34-AA3]MCY0952605.1 hypothetical protein [Streptomyces sp. H27-S2]MCZ4081587.1 hypothetical protein [Streptomyces sp. H34-S5]
MYGPPFAGAVGASALVRLLGWRLGLAVFAAAAGAVPLPARSPVRRLYGLVGVPDRHWRAGPLTAAPPTPSEGGGAPVIAPVAARDWRGTPGGAAGRLPGSVSGR